MKIVQSLDGYELDRLLAPSASFPQLTIRQMMDSSHEVEATLRTIRNELWGNGRIAQLLRTARTNDPMLILMKLLAELHVETGHHIAAIDAFRRCLIEGRAYCPTQFAALIDPESCKEFVDDLAPQIYAAKGRVIDTL